MLDRRVGAKKGYNKPSSHRKWGHCESFDARFMENG